MFNKQNDEWFIRSLTRMIGRFRKIKRGPQSLRSSRSNMPFGTSGADLHRHPSSKHRLATCPTNDGPNSHRNRVDTYTVIQIKIIRYISLSLSPSLHIVHKKTLTAATNYNSTLSLSRSLYFLSKATMELFYYMVFGFLGAVVAAVELSKSNKDRINTPQAFNSFKNNYLLVYSLMMGKPIPDLIRFMLIFVYAFA